MKTRTATSVSPRGGQPGTRCSSEGRGRLPRGVPVPRLAGRPLRRRGGGPGPRKVEAARGPGAWGGARGLMCGALCAAAEPAGAAVAGAGRAPGVSCSGEPHVLGSTPGAPRFSLGLECLASVGGTKGELRAGNRGRAGGVRGWGSSSTGGGRAPPGACGRRPAAGSLQAGGQIPAPVRSAGSAWGPGRRVSLRLSRSSRIPKPSFLL